MLLLLQKGVSLLLGNLFHWPPALVLVKQCSWPICGFLSSPSPVFAGEDECICAATGSLELSSNGHSWHLFFKAGMIRQIQEEPNPSSITSVWESLHAVCCSLTERLTHHFMVYQVAHSSHVGLAVGSPLQLCPLSFLP